MKSTYANGDFRLEPSGDGKVHWVRSPHLSIAIGIDTDDYDDETFPQAKKLVDVLAAAWNDRLIASARSEP